MAVLAAARRAHRRAGPSEILTELDWVMDRAVEHLGDERATRYLRKFYPWYLERLGADTALQDGLQRFRRSARRGSCSASRCGSRRPAIRADAKQPSHSVPQRSRVSRHVPVRCPRDRLRDAARAPLRHRCAGSGGAVRHQRLRRVRNILPPGINGFDDVTQVESDYPINDEPGHDAPVHGTPSTLHQGSRSTSASTESYRRTSAPSCTIRRPGS